MGNVSEDKFLQPVISTIGLIISASSALTPLISQGPTIQLFLDKSLAVPSSFLAFLFAAIIVWMVSSYFRFIYINFGKFVDRGKGYPEYRFTIDNKKAILFLTLLGLFFAYAFFSLHFFGGVGNKTQSILQSVFYVLFFMVLTSIFSILYVNTQDRYKYDEQRKEIARVLFETLSKNGILSTGLQLIENRVIKQDEAIKHNVPAFVNKFVRIRTIKQDDEVIDVVTSGDGQEVIKLLKKQKV